MGHSELFAILNPDAEGPSVQPTEIIRHVDASFDRKSPVGTTTIGDGPARGYRESVGSEKDQGLRNLSKPLFYLVAGVGFEPATFGL
jgi:hypothetical protein